MPNAVPTLALALLLGHQIALPPAPNSDRAPLPASCIRLPDVDDRSPSVAPAPGPEIQGLAGPWTLTWDDSIDDGLDSAEKSCRILLEEFPGALVGRFDGLVLGGERDAVFTGEVFRGGSRTLVTLAQREADYLCTYQLRAEGAGQLRAEGAGVLRGTWLDSRGGGGTAVLRFGTR